MFFTESEKDRIFLEGVLLIACEHVKNNYRKLSIIHRIIIFWTAKILLFVMPYLKDEAIYYLVYNTGIKYKFDMEAARIFKQET